MKIAPLARFCEPAEGRRSNLGKLKSTYTLERMILQLTKTVLYAALIMVTALLPAAAFAEEVIENSIAVPSWTHEIILESDIGYALQHPDAGKQPPLPVARSDR
jgi:hypothetical protein